MEKIFLITGGSRGIGAATARLAAQEGYKVCINYLNNKAAAEKTLQEIKAAGSEAIAVAGDVAKEDDVLRLFEQVDTQLGRLTALVNNAGILNKKSLVQNMSAERIQRIFATNVTGSFLCAREAIKRMLPENNGKGGSIVNVSSNAAKLGAPFLYVDYAATKGAIDTMTIGLARELAAENIRVNAVRPGVIDTDIHLSGGDPDHAKKLQTAIPMKRLGEAEEVAKAILWLLSEEASYVTGAILDVTGGR